MLERIKHLYKGNAIAIAIIITVAIVFLSLSKLGSIQPITTISNVDKYQHCLAYFCLMMSWLLVSYKLNKRSTFQLWIVVGVVLFGVLMEILQQVLTSYRQADVYDVLANTTGVVIAYIVFNKLVFLTKNKKILSKT